MQKLEVKLLDKKKIGWKVDVEKKEFFKRILSLIYQHTQFLNLGLLINLKYVFLKSNILAIVVGINISIVSIYIQSRNEFVRIKAIQSQQITT